MTPLPDSLDWAKGDGLLPAVVQDWRSGRVLMQGWMNAQAYAATVESGRVTFFSRSKQRLWTKGESSGHWLTVEAIEVDCDADSILIQARPHGPTCHRGTDSCFGEGQGSPYAFLAELDALVQAREKERPSGSYTTQLFEGGIRRIAQKVGEEGVESALAGVAQDDAALTGEVADLLFHTIVLLRARGLSLADAVAELARRHRPAMAPAQP
ncbi:bifunctional phosphoribosyl-AMP cyclohydrolase/phosphoribosyl-ATP diphosphatase HisIE [Tahibacter amnicola]|uniref:Histidine biosynthesis bifunctional protein HisIE n=1 Tax=Tahibacter amnicola TaxID=2976241 RepID=A0ABY6BBN5_9GAMM|nr:bifunctional phosphoribosyl-AMP cyclohydrolase/phosphoribosyl-ATP diphosphatase HisIE [Tahibacter amnicola]UXI67104.1 bifunctional phosphoribosyl-AMP cyclohydrolase/phosphoribosyl-ATP diphosphatase HisIE [Tahibacter amnicola]